MFTVHSPRGRVTDKDRPSFRWKGLPTLAEVLEVVGDGDVDGMVMQVDIDLPASRINTYADGRGVMTATYDGRTLTVQRLGLGLRLGMEWDDSPSTFRGAVEIAYNQVVLMFFDIVHGHATGTYTRTQS